MTWVLGLDECKRVVLLRIRSILTFSPWKRRKRLNFLHFVKNCRYMRPARYNFGISFGNDTNIFHTLSIRPSNFIWKVSDSLGRKKIELREALKVWKKGEQIIGIQIVFEQLRPNSDIRNRICIRQIFSNRILFVLVFGWFFQTEYICIRMILRIFGQFPHNPVFSESVPNRNPCWFYKTDSVTKGYRILSCDWVALFMSSKRKMNGVAT